MELDVLRELCIACCVDLAMDTLANTVSKLLVSMRHTIERKGHTTCRNQCGRLPIFSRFDDVMDIVDVV